MTEEEHQMIKRTHDFWFAPHVEGKPTRAEQIDELLSGVRAGKLGFRVALYLAGFVAAVGAAYGSVRGWFK